MAQATTASCGDGGEEMPVSRSTWTISSGSFRDSVCVETSESILQDVGEEGAVCDSEGLVLAKPAGPESDPCEITVCFREKHEIHRVYVRSTARVYEIYYGLEKDGDYEYLCTVRCGPTEKEVILPKGSTPSLDIPEKSTNTSSEEDGWIKVKVPESPLLETNGGTIKTSDQVYFEATAEISDFSPCTNLKLRLLSLQSNEWIHIEEIYIYADPVESTDVNPSSSKKEEVSGNPLMAMLVPSLLQLSKAGGSNPLNHGTSATERMEAMKLQMGRSRLQEQEHENMGTNNSLGLPYVPGSFPEQNNGNLLVEKKLDELILRVGRMEAFFSRFEENIMKPLSSIDSRLQRVEQQLDAISSRTEVQSDPFDSDGGPDLSGPSDESQMVNNMEVVNENVETNDESPVKLDADAEPSLSHPICPGFVNEHDEHSSGIDIPEVKAPLSIDDALTSALKAFILSGSINSHENKMDWDHGLLQESNGIETQVKDAIIDSPSTSESISFQQDEEDPSNTESVDDIKNMDPADYHFTIQRDDHELGTDGLRDADIFNHSNSFVIDKAVDRSKEEARKTLNAFLSGVFEVDCQRLSHTSQEESIFDVKFNKHQESSGVFRFDSLTMDPAAPDAPIDDHDYLNDSVTGRDCSPDSSEIAGSNASAAGMGLLLDLEITMEVAGGNLTADEGLSHQLSSSLI